MNTEPERFCWTRFGTESGEPIEKILRRKEAQRIAHDGMFLWGIGNSVGPAVRELVRLEKHPKVVFSPMRSKPKSVDVTPSRVITWTRAFTLDGDDWEIPEGLHVISRGATETGTLKRTHYALVCRSRVPLVIGPDPTPQIYYEGLVNLLSQNKLGHSQVTAVVEQKPREANAREGTVYAIGFEAELVYPYFIRLGDPSYEGETIPKRRAEQSAFELAS